LFLFVSEILKSPSPEPVPVIPKIPKEVKSETSPEKKQPKVKPLKLKIISTGAPSVSTKPDVKPKLNPPKPNPSLEHQLMGPDNAVVQTTPKKKRPKKAKPHKEKPPEIAESPSLQSPPPNFTIKQDNSGLKMKVCWDDHKAEMLESDLKSDEDQPAIWPSQIQDEQNGQVLVKLKKKKSKKNKLDHCDKEAVQIENNDNSVDNVHVATREVNDLKPPSLEAADHIATQEGQLQIDLDRKQDGKSAKRKRLKKHKKELIKTKHPVIKPDVSKQSDVVPEIKEEPEDEGKLEVEEDSG
jgi:hypothetical protein